MTLVKPYYDVYNENFLITSLTTYVDSLKDQRWIEWSLSPCIVKYFDVILEWYLTNEFIDSGTMSLDLWSSRNL